MSWNYTPAPADGATGWGGWLRTLLAGLKSFLDSLESALGEKADASHTHPATAIQGSTAVGRAVLSAADAAAARAAIGAGTGSGSGSVASTDITDASTVGRAVLTAASAAAARSAIGAGTSSLTLGTSASTAAAGDHGHPASGITDSTAVGRSVLTAASAAAARTAIGAGTSSLALGTTSSTAAAGDHTHTAAAVGAAPSSHTHPATGISDSTAVGRSLLTAASAAAGRSALGVGLVIDPTIYTEATIPATGTPGVLIVVRT